MPPTGHRLISWGLSGGPQPKVSEKEKVRDVSPCSLLSHGPLLQRRCHQSLCWMDVCDRFYRRGQSSSHLGALDTIAPTPRAEPAYPPHSNHLLLPRCRSKSTSSARYLPRPSHPP